MELRYFGLISTRFVHVRDSGVVIRGIDGYRPRPSHEVWEFDRVPKGRKLCRRCDRCMARSGGK